MAIEITDATRVAFLDRHGRFAKLDEAVVTVRIWFNPTDSPLTYTDLTVAEFDALTTTERAAIRNAGSGAGLVETDGISNA